MNIIPTLEKLKKSKKIKKLLSSTKDITSALASIKTRSDAEALLMSGALINVKQQEQALILKHIASIPNTSDLHSSFSFIFWATREMHLEFHLAMSSVEGSGVEDILRHFEEILTRMTVHGISIDNKSYPPHVTDSQYEHLLTTLNSALFFTSKSNTPYKSVGDQHIQNDLSKFWNRAAHYESLRAFILEVENGNYLPLCLERITPVASALGIEKLIGRAKFFMGWTDPSWRDLEIYRDLNYQYDYKNENDFIKINELLKNSNAGKVDLSRGTFKIDLTKNREFELELKKHKIKEHLSAIYGSKEVNFIYNDTKFSIARLIESSLSIFNYADSVDNENIGLCKNNKPCRIVSTTLHHALKISKIRKKDQEILKLLTCDLRNEITTDLPLFKIDEYFVILSSHITSLCFEKVIDKIMSRKDVTLCLPLEKGLVFENEVMSILNKKQLKAIKINGDSSKGIPEFDGLFTPDDNNTVVCEIKCSIKPESRRDAYGFIENHLAIALTQLDVRYDYLQNLESYKKNPQKTISLVIITNHNYFSGLTTTTPKGRPAHVVDSRFLKQLLIENIVPQWHYNKITNSYRRNNHMVRDGNHLPEIISPTKNLIGSEERNIQVQESGIGIYIYSSPNIDKRSYYAPS